MHYVYVLKSEKNGQMYIGMTSNLERRLEFHNRGWTTSTRNYRPWKIVYSEECLNRVLARVREKKLKNGSGREWIKSQAWFS